MPARHAQKLHLHQLLTGRARTAAISAERCMVRAPYIHGDALISATAATVELRLRRFYRTTTSAADERHYDVDDAMTRRRHHTQRTSA